MTTEDAQIAQLYDAVKVAEEAVSGADSVEDIKSALEECAGVAREVAELYEEANSNWTSNGGGADNEEWVEKRDACESFADELESWEPSEEVDEDTVREVIEDENPRDDEEDAGDYDARIGKLVEERTEKVLDEARNEAIDKLGEFTA